MGLTPDQKIDLAIAYIKKCDDLDLLIAVANLTHKRINELLEVENKLRSYYNEDIQE